MVIIVTDDERKKATEYGVIKNAIRTLCVVCAGNEDQVIDMLTGYLWDEEEASGIKDSTGKFELGI